MFSARARRTHTTDDATTATAGKWGVKEHAIEEQYFQKIDKDQRTFRRRGCVWLTRANLRAGNQFAQKLHSKELKSLLQVLPPTHNLSEADLHKLLQWKHAED